MKKELKVKTVQSTPNDKAVKSDATIISRPDRVTANLSIEAFNGCWAGFAYESDIKPGESLDDAKARVYDFVEETVMGKVEELIESNS